MKKIIRLCIYIFLLSALSSQLSALSVFAQPNENLGLTLDINSETIPLPKIFKPNIDLSGRGFHRDVTQPQTVAAAEVLDIWQKDVGFSGLCRLQYDLWEINQLSKDLRNELLANYENIIKRISDSGGVVILDIFGTPAGMGRILDKKSPPINLKAYKELVKKTMRDLSCNKKYNIWYEVWNAPDLEDFYLGRKQDYFNLYRAVAQAKNELEAETKVRILIGGPSASWWFQGLDGNTIVTPEKSLIYEFIKYCYHYHLPLDFISWHGYSSDPAAENEKTAYNKTTIALIRNWLTYFKFDKNTPLIVDEWNYDRNANVLMERQEKSFICASYIPARLRNMYEAGLDNQVYFCLEDFKNNKEGVVRNVGIFSFDQKRAAYKGGAKSIYNVFRMLASLGNRLFQQKIDDEFVGAIATKTDDGIVILIYNYVDPEIVMNYLTKEIGGLDSGERKALLKVINSEKLAEIVVGRLDVSSLLVSTKVKNILNNVRQLHDSAKKFASNERKFKISIKNLKDSYSYQKYAIDFYCSQNCEFVPVEKKDVSASEPFEEVLSLKPYSVEMIVMNKKPPEPEAVPAAESQQKAAQEK